MNTRIKSACAALAVAAGFGTLAATAPASGEYESARFKVTAKGTQSVSWTYNHPDGGTCDVSMTGGGSEKVRFKSKPIVVDAFMAPGEKRPVLLAGDGLVNLSAKATITRRDDVVLGPKGPDDLDCADGPGGGQEPVSDCGTKTTDWKLDLTYNYTKKDRIELAGMNAPDPFTECNASGYGFPYFAGHVAGKETLPKLPASELFDESLGKIIVIGRGKDAIRNAEFSSDGKIQWDVEFRRIKSK